MAFEIEDHMEYSYFQGQKKWKLNLQIRLEQSAVSLVEKCKKSKIIPIAFFIFALKAEAILFNYNFPLQQIWLFEKLAHFAT